MTTLGEKLRAMTIAAVEEADLSKEDVEKLMHRIEQDAPIEAKKGKELVTVNLCRCMISRKMRSIRFERALVEAGLKWFTSIPFRCDDCKQHDCLNYKVFW